MPTWIWPESTARPTAAVRLGRALHALAYAIIGVAALFMLGGNLFVGSGVETAFTSAVLLAGFALVVGGAGRFFRYVLAGE